MESKSGTPIRIDKFGDKVASFFHCQTTLIEQFRKIFSHKLTFSNNRAIVLDPNKSLPVNELQFCLTSALIYHKK